MARSCCRSLGLALLAVGHASAQFTHMNVDETVHAKFMPLADTDPVTLTVGNAKVHLITDGGLTLPVAALKDIMTGNDITDAEWSEFWPDGVQTFSFGVMLVQIGGKNILLDSSVGLYTEGYPYSIHIADSLAKLDLEISDIHYVIFSHLHPDHIGWNVIEVGDSGTYKPFFPNATFVAQNVEWVYWGSTPETRDFVKFDRQLKPLQEANVVELVDGDVEFLPGLSLIRRVGHTPGHQLIKIQDGDEVLYYIGDTVHMLPQLKRPEWSPVWDWSQQQARITRIAVLEMLEKEKAPIASPHLPFPGWGYIIPSSSEGGGWELSKVLPTSAPSRVRGSRMRGATLSLAS